MKKIFKRFLTLCLTVFVCLILVSCAKDTKITLHVFGSELYEIDAKTNEVVELPKIDNRKGFNFVGWYDNVECSGNPITSIKVSENTQVYAKWQKINEYKIVYCSLISGHEEVSEPFNYIYGYDFQFINTKPFSYRSRKIVGYSFTPNGPLRITDSITDEQVFNYSDLNGTVKLYAVWGGPYEIEYKSDGDVYLTKSAMRSAYFTDFYAFIVSTEEGKTHLENNEIYCASDFVNLASDWKGAGRNELTGIGNVAGQFYLDIQVGGKLEDQPTTHFIGYCYQNNKWIDLIEFLMVFFAYWRTDEGYTGGPSDPENTGNDFFASAWASLVDTAKMFYFTSDTLTDKYPWFTKERSERVHYALDHVPGCAHFDILPQFIDDEDIVIPDIQIEGKTFIGWFDNKEGNGERITVLKKDEINEEVVLYAIWR